MRSAPPRAGRRASTAPVLVGLLLVAAATGGCGDAGAGPGEVTAGGSIDLTPVRPPDWKVLAPRAAGELQSLHARLLAAPADVALRRDYAAALDVSALDDVAEAAWLQAAALDPEDARALHHVGRLRAGAGDHAGAVEAFEAACERSADYAPTRWRLGLSLLALGRFDRAEAAFGEARRLAPQDPSGLAGLVRAALERDDLSAAEDLIDDARAEFPGDGGFAELRARVHRRRGDEAAAALLLSAPARPTRCFRADPWTRELSTHRAGFSEDVARARAYLDAGQPQPALALLEPLHAEDPAHLAVESLLVRALLALQDTVRARTILRESLARGDHPRTQVSLGFVHLLAEDHAAALAGAERALELQPDLAAAHLLRARALVGLERTAEAVTALRAAFLHGEASLEAHLLYGRSLAELDRPGDAADALARATEAYPASLQAWALRCEAELRAGRIVEARRSLVEVAARDAARSHLPRLQRLIETNGAPEDGTGEGD